MARNIMGKLLLTFLLVLVIIVPLSSAQIDIQKYSISYDFFSGAKVANPEVCSCSTFIDQVSIVNTGTFGAVFTVETNIPEYARIPFSQVTLEPGETATIDIMIEATCGLDKELDYDVIVKNNLNREQIISRNLRITQCQNLQATLFVGKDSILPCEPLNYQVEITNPSTFTETYIVEPVNFAEFFDAEGYEVVLNPGEVGVVNTTLGLSCDIFGNQTIGFKVTSEHNGLVADLNHELEVVHNYDFTADIPNEINACEDTTTEFEILVNNEARFGNAYKLSLVSAPSFVWLDQERIEIDGESEGAFKIVVVPTNDQIGDYTFIVRAASEFGNEVIEKNVTLHANSCFNIFLDIQEQENPDLCAGEYEMNVLVRNDGPFDENVYLSLDGDYSFLSSEMVSVASGAEKSVKLFLNAEGELDGKKLPLKVTASLNDRETTKTWTDTIEPKIHNQYSCTYAVPLKAKIYVPYGGSETYLGIRNKGLIEASYLVSLGEAENVELEEDKITVLPGETGFVKIHANYLDEPRNNYYALKLTSLDNGVEYDYQLKIVRTNGALVEKVWDFFKVSTCKIIMLILLLLLITSIVIFFVRLARRDSSWKGLWRTRLVLILVGVLIILGVLVFYGFPASFAPPINETGNLTIAWHEDNVKRIDLSDYFSDPDMDTLTYEVAGDEPKNISVSINGNIVTFDPEKDWFGNRRIRFEATDLADESVISPRLTLEVVDVPEYSFLEILAIYCVFFNLLIIIVILGIMIGTPWSSRKKGEGKVKTIGVEKEKGYVYFVDKDGDVSRRRAPVRKARKRKK